MGEHVASGVAAHRTSVEAEHQDLQAVGTGRSERIWSYRAECHETGCSWLGEWRATRSVAQLDADEHARGSVQR